MSWDYLHPDHKILKHGDKLPHWQQGEVMQFVTFRLGDALPKEKIRKWIEQSRAWKSTNPQPWTPEQEKEFHQRFTAKIERWLDEGAGCCLFKHSENRTILEDILMHFQGERVTHHAWVIMPNHLHLLFKPMVPLEKLIQAWKSVSAKQIAQGSIWQRNYRDTMIRDFDHFANAVRYIRRNPVKAGLSEGQFTLWQSEMALRVT
jgi:putative transposase